MTLTLAYWGNTFVLDLTLTQVYNSFSFLDLCKIWLRYLLVARGHLDLQVGGVSEPEDAPEFPEALGVVGDTLYLGVGGHAHLSLLLLQVLLLVVRQFTCGNHGNTLSTTVTKVTNFRYKPKHDCLLRSAQNNVLFLYLSFIV